MMLMETAKVAMVTATRWLAGARRPARNAPAMAPRPVAEFSRP